MRAQAEDTLVSTLASFMFTSLSKTSRITNDLEKKRFIRRKFEELEDQRKVKLELTQEGMTLLDEMYKFHNDLFQEIEIDTIIELNTLFEFFNQIAEKKIKTLLSEKKSKSSIRKEKDV